MDPATRTRVLNTLDRLDGRLRRIESGDARLDASGAGKRTVLFKNWDIAVVPLCPRLRRAPRPPLSSSRRG
jgi:hypothetical protein